MIPVILQAQSLKKVKKNNIIEVFINPHKYILNITSSNYEPHKQIFNVMSSNSEAILNPHKSLKQFPSPS